MKARKIGALGVQPIGLGCMSLSHAYGVPPRRGHSIRLLNQAIDLGYDLLDTAALYGFGANEELIGEALYHRRSQFRLASKCGMTGVEGKRVIDGRPSSLVQTLEESLRRLRTDHIDLYYLHRWDKNVPIEDSVGALAGAVAQGKIGAIGLSEVSAATFCRAHAVHPIAAVQNEYSPWSRNVEFGLLQATAELGVSLVAFSPTGRGFFAGRVQAIDELEEGDLRRAMPRFRAGNFERNIEVFRAFENLAQQAGCTPAQLSLAWVLSRSENVIAIPGTTSLTHLKENFRAREIEVPAGVLAEIDQVTDQARVFGDRYSESTLMEVDTETGQLGG